MRACNILFNRNRNLIEKILLRILAIKLRKLQIKYGIEIPYSVKIGEGMVLPHNSGIIIHSNAEIGKNCSILQGVTIGNNIFKSIYDVAIIGDNVSIGAGAKIVGPVKIGNNVTIGANSVVTKDIESDSIVAGIPARVVSKADSIILNSDYLSREDYFKILNHNVDSM